MVLILHQLLVMGPRLHYLALTALMVAGCAAAKSRPTATVQAAWAVAPQVGEITPVWVEIQCTSGCEGLSKDQQPFITRADVFGLNDQNQYQAALSLDDAASKAGSAQALAKTIAKSSGLATVGKTVGYSTGFGLLMVPVGAGAGAGGGPLGMALGAAAGAMLGTGIIVYGLGKSAYLTLSPEARAYDQLEKESIAEANATTSLAGYFPPRQQGWVYFPAGNYTELKLTVVQELTKGQPFQLQVLQAPRQSTAASVSQSQVQAPQTGGSP